MTNQNVLLFASPWVQAAFTGLGAVCLFSALYYLLHGVIAMAASRIQKSVAAPALDFLVLIPARNEERTVGRAVASVRSQRYPRDRVRVVVLADRCDDQTAEVARKSGADCLDRRIGKPIKGAVLGWGIAQLGKAAWGAVVVLDADAVLAPNFLRAMAVRIGEGQQAIQANKCQVNRKASCFTALAVITNALKNRFFYAAKERMNLSASLQGLGFCLDRATAAQLVWDADSVTEDLHYSIQLALLGVRIHFAEETWVETAETASMRRATSQRFRWSRGRMETIAALGPRLAMAVLRERDLVKFDAFLGLALPNYSLLANLTIGGLAGVAVAGYWFPLVVPTILLIASAAAGGIYFLMAVFALGRFSSGVRALAIAPFFLIWKAAIDFSAVFRRRGEAWTRTHRE